MPSSCSPGGQVQVVEDRKVDDYFGTLDLGVEQDDFMERRGRETVSNMF